MKKNLVRILAFALVLILALGIIPLGALAAKPDPTYPVEVDVWAESYPKHPTVDEWEHSKDAVPWVLPTVNGIGSVTIKTSDYASLTKDPNGNKVDLQGIAHWPDNWNGTSSSAMPVAPSVTFDSTDYVDGHAPTAWLIYTPHQHSLSYWYSDNTTHWKECLTCKKAFGEYYQFMFQNWHSDGDEDRVCDVCGHDIPYHDIDVEEVKGGKITVELEEAPHRKKIVANVEPDEGYKLKKIHFIKVRTDGSEQEITRRKTNKSTWWAYMPTYDLKVTAEFVKKK
ncbi:MAG: hypothetical protein IJN20_00825 [Oscillospiraceae bacterium]|nr:hypothetical protein [Oscillospiraceae bacterium]